MADYGFLKGEGEMAELTRRFNWAATSVGGPSEWSPSLRITVSLILKSKFPMFLWWGDDLIQFYNDAYRPSLGSIGKHPSALGQKGKDCWPEIWGLIYPLIKRVRETGQGTWAEDQLVPIFRDGKIDEVYWTFGYSAITEDNGDVSGVLVICTETTDKVLNAKKLLGSAERLKESEQSLRDVLLQAPVAMSLFMGPEFRVVLTNERALRLWGRTFEQVYQKPIFEAIPEAADQGFMEILHSVFTTGKHYHIYGKPLSIIRDGKTETVYISFNYEPYRDGGGVIVGVLSVVNDVTAEFVSRHKLEESEQRFRDMAESADIAKRSTEESELNLRNMVLQSPIGICVLDAKTLTTEIVNDRFLEVSGRSYEQMIGKYYWEPFAEAQAPYGKALENVVSSGVAFESIEVESVLVRHGRNERLYVTFVFAPLKDPNGNVDKVAVWLLDVTQQVIIRQKIEQSEQEIRSLVEAAPFPIGVYRGQEMRVAFANQAIMDVWGKGTNVIGKLFSDVLPELDNQEVFKQLDEVYKSGIPFHVKNQRLDLNFDGKPRVFYFNYSLTPLFDTKGKIYGVMNTGVDLTELNLAKREVERSEQNLRNTILQSPVAMCIFRGPEFIVEIANDRMIEFWGKPRQALINKPIFVGLPEAASQGFEDILQEVYRTGKTFSAEGVPISLPRNGTIGNVFVDFVYEAYREADDSISGILAVAIDTTEKVIARRQIEQVVAERTKELEEANTSLHKSNAELAQFAYIASHDLQEPIRKISTFAQLLEKNLTPMLNEKDKSFLQKIRNSSTRMQSLIRDVLSYSELVRENENFTIVDLNDVLNAAKTDFELLIEEKQAVIEASHLPTIHAIPLQMSQLINNLLANALKFSKNNTRPIIKITTEKISGVRLSASLPLDGNVDFHHITFSDNGIGFESEYADQIFSIFKRLHRKSEFEGTGIGLAMCKKIAQNHHGSLDANGSSTDGAVFNIYLPASN